jgi:hypothetical protein
MHFFFLAVGNFQVPWRYRFMDTDAKSIRLTYRPHTLYSKPDKLLCVLETKNERLAELRFVGKISKMGDRMIITIPPEYHEQAKKLKGKHLRVVADDQW